MARLQGGPSAGGTTEPTSPQRPTAARLSFSFVRDETERGLRHQPGTEGVGVSEGVGPALERPLKRASPHAGSSEWHARSAPLPHFEWHAAPARLGRALRKSGRSGGSGDNALARTRARR